ncbi:hypothetical protein [Clostridium saccharoperbutylacetonicum]|nr:hypothetical protein [Clostridium saccharoperbutylacetonicum]
MKELLSYQLVKGKKFFIIALLLPICFFDYNKNKVSKKTLIVFNIIIAMFILFLYAICFPSSKYFYFKSPYENNKRVLIVNETYFLGSGTGYFYERKNIIFIKCMNQSINYDSTPFSNREVKVKWLDEKNVQIDYINNSVGHHETELIKFDE